MDQASADMQTKAQKPQNQKNDKNRPKHGSLLISTGLMRSAARCRCSRLPESRAALLLAAVTDHGQICDRHMTVLGVVFIHAVLLHLSLGVFLHPVGSGV